MSVDIFSEQLQIADGQDYADMVLNQIAIQGEPVITEDDCWIL